MLLKKLKCKLLFLSKLEVHNTTKLQEHLSADIVFRIAEAYQQTNFPFACTVIATSKVMVEYQHVLAVHAGVA